MRVHFDRVWVVSVTRISISEALIARSLSTRGISGASSESFRSTSRLECPVNFEKSREETDSVFFSVSDKGNSGFIRAWRISSLTPARFARWIKVWIWEAVVTFIRPSFSASAISGEVVKARIAWTRR